MLITCPSCSAQYEVASGMIPETGRDVQCSACGQVWFVDARASTPASAAARPVTPIPGGGAVTEAPGDGPDAWIGDATEQEGRPPEFGLPFAGPPADEAAPTAPTEVPVNSQTEAPAGPPTPRPVARAALSPEVAAILREEAERERLARDRLNRPRQGDPAALETQPDLGLDDPGEPDRRRAEEARARMDRLRGAVAADLSAGRSGGMERPASRAVEPDEEYGLGPGHGVDQGLDGGSADERTGRRTGVPARARLPDIEEINSSLRAASERAPASVAAAAQHREEAAVRGRGFRYGFAFVIAVASLATAVYAFAEQLGRAVPVLSSPLERYVATVDDLRLWLDVSLQSLIPPDGGGATLSDPQPGVEAPQATAPDSPPALPDDVVTGSDAATPVVEAGDAEAPEAPPMPDAGG